MASLLIVGNGFDLACKAKTSYADFFECLKLCFYSEKYENFEKKYLDESNEKYIRAFYELVACNKDNYFINYFINYNMVFGDWVSFETELTRIIKSFDSLVHYLHIPEIANMSFGGDYVELQLKILDKPDLMSVLNVYSDNKFFKAFTDYREIIRNKGGMNFYIKGHNCKSGHVLLKVIDDFSINFPKKLFSDLSLFSKLFSIYLNIVKQKAVVDFTIRGTDDVVFAVNYNYTDYLESIFVNRNMSNNIFHINGQAYDGICKCTSIFGVDSTVSFHNHEFDLFLKSVQRLIKNVDSSVLNKAFRGIVKNVYIFGHSLYTADTDTLKALLTNNFGKDGLQPNLYIYYFDEDSKINLILNLKSILGDSEFDSCQKAGFIHLVESKVAIAR